VNPNSKINIPQQNDTLQSKNTTFLFPIDSLSGLIIQDSTQLAKTPPKKELLQHNIKQSAKDRIKNDLKAQKVYLYNEARIEYDDRSLEDGKIILDNKKREVYAYGIPDSVGNYTQRPVFVQGNRKVEPDSIRFNIDTKKALVYESRTEEGEFKIKGAVTKREN